MRIFATILLFLGCLNSQAQRWGSFAGKFYGDGSSLTNLSIGGGAGIPTLNGSGTNTTLYFRGATWGTNNSNLDASGDTAILSGRGHLIAGSSDNSVICGGLSNGVSVSSTLNAFMGGGISNLVNGGTAGVLAGGALNQVAGQYGALAGGLGNQIQGSGTDGAIGGGTLNIVNAVAATIPGGQSNRATANFTFASGYRADAASQGAFVWGDSTDAVKKSVAADTFNIFSAGGGFFNWGSSTLTNIGTFTNSGAVNISGATMIGGNANVAGTVAATNGFVGDASKTTGRWRKEVLYGTISTNGALSAATFFAPLSGNTTVLQVANTNRAFAPIGKGGYYSNFVFWVSDRFPTTTNAAIEIQTNTVAAGNAFVGGVKAGSAGFKLNIVGGAATLLTTNSTTASWPAAALGTDGYLGAVALTTSAVINQTTYGWSVEHWYQDN